MPQWARQGNKNVPAVLRQTFYWINVDHPNRAFLLSNLFESVKKKRTRRKVFIFSKTYKENFVFLRGGETRGKAETSVKDSTITTSRCFFWGEEIYFGIEMKMTTKCHKGICQMSVGKGIAREPAQKWPAGTSNESNIGRKSCDLSFCFRLYCSRLSNRQPCCVVARR